jgi:hypothetical protein
MAGGIRPVRGMCYSERLAEADIEPSVGSWTSLLA